MFSEQNVVWQCSTNYEGYKIWFMRTRIVPKIPISYARQSSHNQMMNYRANLRVLALAVIMNNGGWSIWNLLFYIWRHLYKREGRNSIASQLGVIYSMSKLQTISFITSLLYQN